MSGDINNVIKEHVDRHESNIDPQEIWDGINKKRRRKRIAAWFWPLSFSLCFLALISQLDFDTSIDTNTKLALDATESQETRESKPDYKTEAKEPKVVTTTYADKITSSPSTNETGATTITKSELQNDDSSLQQTAVSNQSNDFKKVIVREAFRSQLSSIPQQHIKNQFVTRTILSPTAQKFPHEFDKIGIEQPNKNTAYLLVQELEDLRPVGSYLSYMRPKLSDNSLPELSILTQPIKISPWQVSLASGTGLATKELSSHDQTLEDYIVQRSSFERPELTINNELLVSYKLNSNWAISSGLQHQKVYDRFEWDGIILRNISGDNVGILNSLSEELSSSLTAVYYEAEQREIAYPNSYVYVDVPVFVSYTVSNSKWRPTLALGAAVNVHKKQKGYIIDEAGIPVALEELDSASFMPGLKYMAEFSATYPLTKRLALSGQLGGSMRLIEDPFVTAKYQWIDLSLGLHYKL